MQKQLGAMYVIDPRFKANLDRIAAGYAQYLAVPQRGDRGQLTSIVSANPGSTECADRRSPPVPPRGAGGLPYELRLCPGAWRCARRRGRAILRDDAAVSQRGEARRLVYDGDWLGIRFKAGAFLPGFLPGTVRDRSDVNLQEATKHSLWLTGSAWEYPTFENADTFVAQLVKKGILVRDRLVDAVLGGEPDASSRRA